VLDAPARAEPPAFHHPRRQASASTGGLWSRKGRRRGVEHRAATAACAGRRRAAGAFRLLLPHVPTERGCRGRAVASVGARYGRGRGDHHIVDLCPCTFDRTAAGCSRPRCGGRADGWMLLLACAIPCATSVNSDLTWPLETSASIVTTRLVHGRGIHTQLGAEADQASAAMRACTTATACGSGLQIGVHLAI
jgi:hypothetical protein